MRKLVFALLLSSIAFGDLRAASYKAVPGGVRYEYIGEYDVDRLNKITTSELKEFSDSTVVFPSATNAVALYRVI